MSNSSTFLFWPALHNVVLPHPCQQFCIHTQKEEQWSQSPGEETRGQDYWGTSTLPCAKDRTVFKPQTPMMMMMVVVVVGMSQGSNPTPQHVTTPGINSSLLSTLSQVISHDKPCKATQVRTPYKQKVFKG